MAARGQKIKTQIMQKILDTFEGSFINDKEIRICGEEDGYPIQIKVTLTAAKENIDNPNEIGYEPPQAADSADTVEVSITSEEKKTVAQLLACLGL